MAAFGSAVGVAIALAVVCFALRGKEHLKLRLPEFY